MIPLFICYMMTFYSSHKDLTNDEIILPNQPIYQLFKDNITKDITDVRKLKYEEFSIKSFDGLTLYGKYYESIKGAPIEIMFHGYRGSGERDLSTGVKRAFLCKRNALVVDQRASGKSDGHTISFGINERHDCLNWINFVVKHFGDDVKIILTGISMGAATVMMTTGEKLPSNVVCAIEDCGYTSVYDAYSYKIPKMIHIPSFPFVDIFRTAIKKRVGFDIKEASALNQIKKSNTPTLFIHGNDDSVVPVSMAHELYNNASCEKELMVFKKANHEMSALLYPDKYWNKVWEFIKKYE